MKKIRLGFLSLFASAFCAFAIPYTSLAVEDTAGAAPNGSPQENATSETYQEASYGQEIYPNQEMSSRKETETEQEAPAVQGVLPESSNGIYENAGALWQSWMGSRQPDESPYPSYICGAWSTDGTMENLTFAVTKDEAGEAGKKEILDLVVDDSSVSFTYLSYPYHELWAIQLTLREQLGDKTGAYGIGIYEDENRIHIDIDASNENSEAFMQECFQKYQDRVCFEIGSGNDTVQTTIEEYNSYFDKGGGSKGRGQKTGQGILPWIWVFCIGMFSLFGVIFLRTHFLAVFQTTKGSITASSPVTKKQTVEAIRKNTAEPGPGAFQSILKKLDEE